MVVRQLLGRAGSSAGCTKRRERSVVQLWRQDLGQGCVQDEPSYTPHSIGATEKDWEIESDWASELCVSVVGRICQVLHTHREH